jgi:hypothetical protein
VSASNGHRSSPTEPEALRAEIARTRMDLGETVSALAAKVDVKARAQERVGRLRGDVTERARHTADEVRGWLSTGGGLGERRGPYSRWPLLGVVAALTLLMAGIAARRRRDQAAMSGINAISSIKRKLR